MRWDPIEDRQYAAVDNDIWLVITVIVKFFGEKGTDL